MGEPETVRRKRLAYRSLYRGVRETDIIFRRFVDRHLDDLDGADLDRYEALLDEHDQDILSWVTGRVPVPVRHDHTVFQKLSEDVSANP
ncbi:MAG: succinate dehydrogenase assembly factor 2 [Geminicoccaceae bacterium]|nr:MAG: succinate dehydrogenase assembly factor 2 [Geminicoccaceae bacterium]